MRQSQIDEIQHRWILEQAKPQCLHIGCGERYIPGAVNADPNPDREHWRDVDWYADDIPVADGTFDTVVSNHVLQAVEYPLLALVELRRVLKVGGTMAHVIPDHRFAPFKQDGRFPFQWMHNCWKGPEAFRSLLEQVEGLHILECASFTEFQWSFKVVAQKVCRASIKDSIYIDAVQVEERTPVSFYVKEIVLRGLQPASAIAISRPMDWLNQIRSRVMYRVGY